MRGNAEGGRNALMSSGNGIRKKQDHGDWRILVGNINTFPREHGGEGKAKLDAFNHLATSSDSDIILLSEHNTNVKNTFIRDRPSQVMQNWWRNVQCRFEYIRSHSTLSYEQGGTAIITHSRSTAHTKEIGGDDRQLGRWNWITVQGKGNKKTTIVSIYRPRKGQQTANRQLARIRKNVDGDIRETQPHLLWIKDLEELIAIKRNAGSEIIVAGDFNDDLNNEYGTIRKMMERLNLREVLIELHGKGPNTHNRGTETIDGVFASEGIDIKQGGYSTFEESPSDHRWLWVDIIERHIVGTGRDDRSPPMLRKATSKIPSVRKAFNALLEEEVRKHKLGEKMDKVYNYAEKHEDLSTEMKELYETVEDRIRRAIKAADTNCRKIKKNTVPFSKQQRRLMGAIRVLRMIRLRKIMTGAAKRPKSRNIERMAKKYNFTDPLTYDTREEIEKRIKEAAEAYNTFRPKAHKARESYLYKIAEELAGEDGKEIDHHYKQLISRERTKHHWKRIKSCEGRSRGGGVEKVLVETDEGQQMRFEKTEIEDAIISANQKKLLQAKDTPFRKEPLQSLVGEQMDFDKWEEILKKAIKLPDDLEEGTQIWYDYIQNYDDNPEKITWTTEEYCDSWRQMKEEKGSLPGIHSAHLKCLDHTSKAAEVISRLALVPILTGYAPTQWKKGIDSMIPKKEGEWRPEKLRLILLMDARFNHNNKLIGKKVMEYGENKGLLAPEQYGSRKEKSAIEHAINKRLTLDIARQAKMNAIYIANDATSCYDRILLMVAYLTMRNFGIPECAAQSSIETIFEMEHFVRTSYGDSKTSYGGPGWEVRPHGSGQGNGWAPAIWAGISSLLLKAMRDKGYGTRITSPISRVFLHMAGYSFVDDTDIIETSFPNESWESLFERTQKGLELWECLLRTTGGAIEPSKSHWVRISHKWKNGRATLDKPNLGEALQLKDANGNITNLKQECASVSKRTLGVWQSPDGDETGQKEKLIEKINKWSDSASARGMTHIEARTAVKHTIGKTIRYPLAATALSKKECNDTQKIMKKETIGKMKVVRTAPDMVVYAPTQFGGLGQRHIYEDQTIDHITAIMQHGHSPTITGSLIRTSLEYLAMEAGLPGDPMLYPIYDMPWICDKTWIDTTLKSLADHQITIESSIKGLSDWSNQDAYLMEFAPNVVSGKDLNIFNKVRMFLQVATLSDLMTADGKEIDLSKLHGRNSITSPNPSKSAYIWPSVPTPSNSEITLWSDTLQKMLSITTNNRRIHGQIEKKWHDCSMNHIQWNYQEANDTIYQKLDDGWKTWKRLSSSARTRRASRKYTAGPDTDSLPNGTRPATIEFNSATMIILQNTGRYHNTGNHNQQQHENLGWTAAEVQATNAMELQFADDIRNKTARIISDGSYAKGRSSAAFVTQHDHTRVPLNNVDPHGYIHGQVTVPGDKDEQSSYRGELGGILASIVYTNGLCRRNNVTTGKCTMGCDNTGALSAIFGWKRPTPRWASYDLICMIKYHIKQSPIQWVKKHVKGHQDDHKNFQELDEFSQANVLADQLAKAELRLGNIVEIDNTLAGQNWQLHCNGKMISGDIDRLLRNNLHEEKMHNRWCTQFGIEGDDVAKYDWDTFKRVCRASPEGKKIWFAKHNARIGPVKYNLVRRKHDDDPTCPRCGDLETTEHTFMCKDEKMEEAFNTHLEPLESHLRGTTTKAIAESILETCRSIRYARDHTLDAYWDGELADIVQQQTRTGQRAFIGGLWPKKWLLVQQQYYTKYRSKKSPSVWMAKTIALTQNVFFEMWQVRCTGIYGDEESDSNKALHIKLNSEIDEAVDAKPHNRLLPHEDANFFKTKKEDVKKYKLQRKKNWVRDAQKIIQTYAALSDNQGNLTNYVYIRRRRDG